MTLLIDVKQIFKLLQVFYPNMLIILCNKKEYISGTRIQFLLRKFYRTFKI